MVHEGSLLTPKELEVARLVTDGCTNPEIAAELLVSVGTVNAHVHVILGKLGARRRAEIAKWYAQEFLTE